MVTGTHAGMTLNNISTRLYDRSSRTPIKKVILRYREILCEVHTNENRIHFCLMYLFTTNSCYIIQFHKLHLAEGVPVRSEFPDSSGKKKKISSDQIYVPFKVFSSHFLSQQFQLQGTIVKRL